MAEGQGVRVLNGEGMLFYQAYYADCIYLGEKADERTAETLYKKYLSERGE